MMNRKINHQKILTAIFSKRRVKYFQCEYKLKQIILIDVHSGLGDYGKESLFVDNINDYSNLKKILSEKNWNKLSPHLEVSNTKNKKQNNNTNNTNNNNNNVDENIKNINGMYEFTEGDLSNWCYFFSPHNDLVEGIYQRSSNDNNKDTINCLYITQEFGTLKDYKVFKALRDENTVYHWGNAMGISRTIEKKKQKKLLKMRFMSMKLNGNNQLLNKEVIYFMHC